MQNLTKSHTLIPLTADGCTNPVPATEECCHLASVSNINAKNGK